MFESCGRFWTNRIIRVHIGGANDPLFADHVPRGHWQSVFRLVVKPVQSATERPVQLPQVIRQCEDKSKLFSGLKMKIRQNVEGQVQLLMKTTCVTVELRRECDDTCSEDLLQTPNRRSGRVVR